MVINIDSSVLTCTRLLKSLASRGGMKESGIGRENGLEAFESCKNFLF